MSIIYEFQINTIDFKEKNQATEDVPEIDNEIHFNLFWPTVLSEIHLVCYWASS